MATARLTFLLSHLVQAEVDDSGSQAEANQSDRPPALGGEGHRCLGGDMAGSSRISALKRVAPAHSSGPAVNLMNDACASPATALPASSDGSIRRVRALIHTGVGCLQGPQAAPGWVHSLSSPTIIQLPSLLPPETGLIYLVTNDCREVGPFWSRERRWKVPQM